MQLRYLERGAWSLVEAVEEGDAPSLITMLEEAAADRPADVAKMIGMFQQAANNRFGPRGFSRELVHEVGENIWEFRAGKLRVLFFVADGRVVVCCHAFRKTTQKTPKRDRDRAVRARDRYSAAKRAGELEFLEE